jgi:DNA-binding transcriptional LysR family regulator
MIENRQLAYCRELASLGHFGRAAEALGISQPALTRSIQNLERSLGVRLFDRRRGRVEPTPFGEVLLERGERILDESEELLRQLRLLRGLDIGQLIVSAGLYPAEVSAHRAVAHLIRRRPNIRCRVKLCDWRRATADVLTREADIALAELSEAENEPQLVTRPVGNHPLVFFARPAHPLTADRPLSLERLFAYPLAGTRGPARMTRHFPKKLGSAGWIDDSTGDFVSAIQVDSITATVQVVANSDAISAAPVSLIEKELKSETLVELPFQAPWLRLNYGFIYLRERTLSPTTETFMREVEAIESSFGSWT